MGAEKAEEKVDVRLISATNAAHDRLHDENFFRPDLLYRINTVEITLPPLRERVPGRSPLLLQHFSAFYAQNTIPSSCQTASARGRWSG